MVYIHSSVSECKSTALGNCMNFRNKKAANNSNPPKTPACNGSPSAAIDVVILIAVIGASGFLLHPYVNFITVWLVGDLGTIAFIVKEEFYEEPIIYSCIIVGISCSAIATCGLFFMFLSGPKCNNPNCRGLRKAAEFDIQLETEECLKSSLKSPTSDGLKTGLFRLQRDHHKELESELKKIAPPNGRAVLVLRARCGCAVGKMEVPGQRLRRKIK